MTGLTNKLLLILIPALVILAACMSLLVVLPDGSGGNVYVEQINTARRYAENGDYQNAIVYYKNAIKKDDTKEDPYIELAKIYFYLNMNEEGFDILRSGIEKTNSLVLIEALDYYEEQLGSGSNNSEKLKKLGKIDFNSTYTNVFAAYNFGKYTAECTVKKEQTSADVYTVIYEQYDAVFEYANSPDNMVLDLSTGKPYDYARPTSIRLNRLSLLIAGVESGVSVDELKACGASNISVKPFDKTLNTFLVTFNYSNMSITLGCDENGTVTGDESYNEITPEKGQPTIKKVKTAGKIIDVTSGKKVSGVTINFREGKNNKDGDVVASETAGSGEYSVELVPGDYTVEVIAEGYNKEYFELYVSDNGTDIEQNFSISPSLSSNEIRFVLEWGATPQDLDSYLDGATSDGTRVAVSYFNKKVVKSGKTIAELDLDDISGFGPETTTLYNTDGKYEYKVHRYSFAGDLASSGATVKIYTSSSSNPIVITVPNNVDSEWWTVCTIDKGEIKNINGKVS